MPEIQERLLSIEQIAKRTSCSAKTIRRNLLALKVSGLQQVPLSDKSPLVRFREESLNQMIKRAAERGEPLIRTRRQKAIPAF